jgi:solute carrier family 25 protein 39/40
MWEMAKAIRAREGLPVLWRGTSASLLIAVPMVGIYMPLYDSLLDSWSSKLGSLAPVVSGTAARAGAVFCVAPFELLRTRIQATSAAGASLRSTLATFVNEHQQPTASASAQAAAQQQHPPAQALQRGVQQAPVPAQQQLQPAQVRPGNVLCAVPRMWTGFSATLVRDVPFSALYWALVEPLRQAMLPLNSHWPPLQCIDKMLHHKHATSSTTSISAGSGSAPTAAAAGAVLPPSQQRLMHHSQLEILIANLVSGFVAGGLAAGITTPFDVVKTRMQIASPSQQQQQGLRSNGNSGGGIRVFNILAEVYRKEGMEGLFSGLKPRAARAAPACAIVISVYELLKSQLTPARQ